MPPRFKPPTQSGSGPPRFKPPIQKSGSGPPGQKPGTGKSSAFIFAAKKKPSVLSSFTSVSQLLNKPRTATPTPAPKAIQIHGLTPKPKPTTKASRAASRRIRAFETPTGSKKIAPIFAIAPPKKKTPAPAAASAAAPTAANPRKPHNTAVPKPAAKLTEEEDRRQVWGASMQPAKALEKEQQQRERRMQQQQQRPTPRPPLQSQSSRKPPPPRDPRQLAIVNAIPQRFRVIFPFKDFNLMQSQLYPQIFDDVASLVVSSPTGSGKTALLELALVKLLASNPEAKAVYMAPTKALCSERFEDWKKKFQEKLGMNVNLVSVAKIKNVAVVSMFLLPLHLLFAVLSSILCLRKTTFERKHFCFG